MSHRSRTSCLDDDLERLEVISSGWRRSCSRPTRAPGAPGDYLDKYEAGRAAAKPGKAELKPGPVTAGPRSTFPSEGPEPGDGVRVYISGQSMASWPVDGNQAHTATREGAFSAC